MLVSGLESTGGKENDLAGIFNVGTVEYEHMLLAKLLRADVLFSQRSGI